MGYLPDAIVEELTGSHELGIFMRIATSPPLHMWTGLHDIGAQIESVDSTGQTYLGAGRLIGLDTLETQINGTSDSVEFTLSGIDPATGDQLIDSIPPVRGCEVTIGITTLDQYWQPMTSIIPIWQGTASHTGESSAVPQGDEPRTVSLSLIVTTGSFTRSRPSQATWTHAAHIAEHPGDLFCQQVARLSRGVQPVWPNY